jgi:hypothetical protein
MTRETRGGPGPDVTPCFGRHQIRTFAEGENDADPMPLAGAGLFLAAPVVVSLLLGADGDGYPTWLVWAAVAAALVGAVLVAVAAARALRRRRRIVAGSAAFNACPNSPVCVQASLEARFTEPCSVPAGMW